MLAKDLTADWLDASVRVPVGRSWHKKDTTVHYREGDISMITHCRKYTRIRLGQYDFRVKPDAIIERL